MFLRLSIAFISAAVLGYEVLLTRLLSIIHWHHFAYMIISLALLGFGVSGTFISLVQRRLLTNWSSVFAINAFLFGLTIPGSFMLAQNIPFNALEFAWDARQIFYLLGFYLLLTIPFFCAANCIGLALARFKDDIHQLYRFDLLGAGLGALGIILALFYLKPNECLRLLSLLAFLSSSLILISKFKSPLRFIGIILLIVLPFLWPSSWTSLNLSEYKSLSLTQRIPKTKLIHESSSPLGQISVMESPLIPFRHAPGLSLNNTQEPPPQLGVFTDGDSMTAMTRYDGTKETIRYLDLMTSALPYHLLRISPPHPNPLPPREREASSVLILGAGGGSDVLLARYHNAKHIDAVELNPQIIDLVKNEYRNFAGNIYGLKEVTVHADEGRGFVKKSFYKKIKYNLIQVSLLDSFSAASAGLYALNENYLYTIEAFQDYLSILEPNGLLAITRWTKVPPRDALKLFATALEALNDSVIENPELQLALIRGWKTSTLLVKNGIFDNRDTQAILNFCDQRSFDVVYYPGIYSDTANRYNQLASPYFHEGTTALLGDNPKQFRNDYKFNITPSTDDSPYFFHFLKWKSLPEILSLRDKGGLPLLEWGYPILIGTLLQAMMASLFLILLPLWSFKKQAIYHRGATSVLIYFFSLGLAFLFIEMSFIQRFILFLSHPLFALSVVLCGFLVFGGLGSGTSPRLTELCGGSRSKAIALAVTGIVTLSLLYYILLPMIFDVFLPYPDIYRILISLLLIAPLAFFMGMPFPLGLAVIGNKEAALIPWAWGINGCASVISAILATLIAIHFGFSVVIFLAMGLYVMAAVSLRRIT